MTSLRKTVNQYVLGFRPILCRVYFEDDGVGLLEKLLRFLSGLLPVFCYHTFEYVR